MRLSIIKIITVLYLSFNLIACGTPDEKANKLFVEAAKLVEEGLKMEMNNYSKSLEFFNDALTKIENITEKYPSSQLAVKITQDTITIGTMKLSVFKNKKLKDTEFYSNLTNDLSLFAQYLAYKYKSNTYYLRETADEYSKGQQFAKVEDLMKHFAGEEKVDRMIINAIELAKHGNKEMAMEKLIEARKLSTKLYEAAKGRTHGNLAGAYTKLGEHDKAIECLKVVQKGGKKDKSGHEYLAQYQKDGLIAIGRVYAEEGEIEKASNTYQLYVKDRKYRFRERQNWIKKEILTHIGIKHAKDGRIKMAQEAINNGCTDRHLVLTEIGLYYKKNNQAIEAQNAFASAINSAKREKRRNSRKRAFNQIAYRLVEAGEYDIATGYAANGGYIDQTICDIAYFEAKSGNVINALKKIQRISCSKIFMTTKVIVSIDNYLNSTSKKLDKDEKILINNIIYNCNRK